MWVADGAGPRRLAALILRKGRGRFVVATPGWDHHVFRTLYGACSWARAHADDLLVRADGYRAELQSASS